MSDFDTKDYVIRVLRMKGHTLKDPDTNDIFVLQWPSWKALIERHRIGDDPEKAEHLLMTFGHREVIGGASKVLETFAQHLEAQPRQGGSPDWSQAGREWGDCAYCDNRGIVSDVPCRVMRHGVPVERKYSFACVCRAGDRFPGMRKADDWMIDFAIQRKQAEIDRHEGNLRRYGIDPNADGAVRASQFRRAFRGMTQAVGKNGVTAKTVRPPTESEARAMLAEVKKRHRAEAPEHLNPEVAAYAVYANGDERGDIF